MCDRCGDPVIGNPSITQTRHRFHLTEALKSLELFIRMADDGFGKLKKYHYYRKMICRITSACVLYISYYQSFAMLVSFSSTCIPVLNYK